MNVVRGKMSKTISVGIKSILSALVITTVLSGCGIFTRAPKEEVDLNLPPRELIVKGMDYFNVGNYPMANKSFEEILDRYPFSPEAPLAELKSADANFYMGHFAEALLLYEEFESRHPTNEAIPYVMYQKGMCNYKQIDRVDRDTTGAIKAIQSFSQLLRAYPYSPYTEEAKARIRAANEFLVHHEYFVVKFYLRTKKYNQAKTRLKYLLTMYPDSSIAPQASELLAQLEADKLPQSSIADFFPEFTLPDWSFFSTDGPEDGQQD